MNAFSNKQKRKIQFFQLSKYKQRELWQMVLSYLWHIYREDFYTQMATVVLEGGGSTIMYEQSVQVLRNEYIRAGKDFPFVIIPQR